MSIRLIYVDGGEGVEWVGTGVVTGRQLKAAKEEIYSEPVLSRLKHQLVDLTDAERFDISNSDIMTLAEQDSRAARLNPGIILAVVARRDLEYGLARIWEAYIDVDEGVIETRVFRDRASAEIWTRERLEEQAKGLVQAAPVGVV